MACRLDNYDQALVIDGFSNGIADDPFDGISDMRNVNIISVPGEGSVNFATSEVTSATGAIPTISIVSANSATNYITATSITGLEGGMAVVVSAGTGGITSGLYWVGNINGAGGGTFKLYTDYATSNVFVISSTGTGTLNVPTAVITGGGAGGGQVGAVGRYFATDGNVLFNNGAGQYFFQDAIGRVWSNKVVSSVNSYWTWTGNTIGTYSNGNGLVFRQASDGTGYLFAFSAGSIDYTPTSTVSWVYGWNPADGSTGNSASPGYLKSGVGNLTISHAAATLPDSTTYYCDSNWIGSFYQTDPTIPFVPTSTSTYTFQETELLPYFDTANCLAFLNNNVLIGGLKNNVYVWDGFSGQPFNIILLAENLIANIVTVNTNAYIFAGNRGRIYITNGSQAQLYKKVPDHISGTVEPYFTWGGAMFNKNQLFFGVQATTNSGTAITQYGGIWAIDLDTTALRLVNQLSYGTYAGIATGMIAQVPLSPAPAASANPPGTGYYAAWDSGASTYGIDQTTGAPYTTSVSTIDSDLIPIGTYTKPRNFTQIEYRLTRPLVAGESITIGTRILFNTENTGYTVALTDSTAGNYSNRATVNFSNAQWVQFQVTLNSTAINPSYVRLKEIRILGLEGPTLAQQENLSL
jgi:hypothetical protein